MSGELAGLKTLNIDYAVFDGLVWNTQFYYLYNIAELSQTAPFQCVSKSDHRLRANNHFINKIIRIIC
jgi:hypothetical protein